MLPIMKKLRIIVILCLAISGIARSEGILPDPGPVIPQTQDTLPESALILIDIQEFYFDTTRAPLTGRFEASKHAGEILEYFRETGQEVVHIMHKGGGDIHELVAPLAGEKVIVKEHVSCFRETPLLEYLQDKQVKRLVIVGMMTHMCVEAAIRAAADLGFETMLIHDACATRDLIFEDEVISARDVHLSTLSTLRAYAKILSTREFLGE
jgi:nicotinamidase-related amidase